MEDPAVTSFRQYLRIRTVQPAPDYAGALDFLTRIVEEIGLEHRTVEPAPGRPLLIATLKGTDPALPSILLNSHTDVVPVFPEHWKCDPFEGFKDEQGRIYGRGTQDMKCVTIQYLEALRRLKGTSFKRTVHLTFMPEEEVGGHLGMERFIESDDWKALNVGFALDEGLANPGEEYTVFYGERFAWWMKITCPGNPGHGSRFIENTAAEKLRHVVNRLLDLRETERKRLEANPDFTLGDVTTVNLTKLEGGVQVNVVPDQLAAYFDMRITPSADLHEMERSIRRWCDEAGPDVRIEFLQKLEHQVLTPVHKGDPWWDAFSSAAESLNLKLKCEIFPAGTDSRFLRKIGLPALGFSPMNRTPILLHDHNEYLDEQIFLKGIDIYEAIIPALANV